MKSKQNSFTGLTGLAASSRYIEIAWVYCKIADDCTDVSTNEVYQSSHRASLILYTRFTLEIYTQLIYGVTTPSTLPADGIKFMCADVTSLDTLQLTMHGGGGRLQASTTTISSFFSFARLCTYQSRFNRHVFLSELAIPPKARTDHKVRYACFGNESESIHTQRPSRYVVSSTQQYTRYLHEMRFYIQIFWVRKGRFASVQNDRRLSNCM